MLLLQQPSRRSSKAKASPRASPVLSPSAEPHLPSNPLELELYPVCLTVRRLDKVAPRLSAPSVRQGASARIEWVSPHALCACMPVCCLCCLCCCVCQEGALAPSGSRLLFSKVSSVAAVRDRCVARLRLTAPVKARLWYRPEQAETCPWVPLRAVDATIEEAQVRPCACFAAVGWPCLLHWEWDCWPSQHLHFRLQCIATLCIMYGACCPMFAVCFV